MNTHALVASAIRQRLTLVARYGGHRRELCPHLLGTKDGRAQVLCYQFAGGSDSGLEPDGSPANWRCLRVDQLELLAMVGGPWHTASDYAAATQTCVDAMEVAV